MVGYDREEMGSNELPLSKMEKKHYALYRCLEKRSEFVEDRSVDEGYSIGGVSDQYDCIDSSEFCTGKSKEAFN